MDVSEEKAKEALLRQTCIIALHEDASQLVAKKMQRNLRSKKKMDRRHNRDVSEDTAHKIVDMLAKDAGFQQAFLKTTPLNDDTWRLWCPLDWVGAVYFGYLDKTNMFKPLVLKKHSWCSCLDAMLSLASNHDIIDFIACHKILEKKTTLEELLVKLDLQEAWKKETI